MPLRSMTGFARADGAGEGYRWTWEIRTVNGKGLDMRLRLPPGFDYLDPAIRERLASALRRGSVQVGLTVHRQAGATRVRVNQDVLAEMIAAMAKVRESLEAQAPTLDGVLSLRGVIETEDAEPDEEMRAALSKLILADVDRAFAELVAAREREGAAIASVLATRLDEIARLTQAAEESPARTVEAIRARLAEQIAALTDASPALDPDRLHQEAAILATKADVREELDRLAAHVDAARAMLADDGAVGRRLDFLAQEFNREVNTFCSKAADRSLTAIGLDLKAVVDQLREQIQNVE